jgi:hypothetical protein
MGIPTVRESSHSATVPRLTPIISRSTRREGDDQGDGQQALDEAEARDEQPRW